MESFVFTEIEIWFYIELNGKCCLFFWLASKLKITVRKQQTRWKENLRFLIISSANWLIIAWWRSFTFFDSTFSIFNTFHHRERIWKLKKNRWKFSRKLFVNKRKFIKAFLMSKWVGASRGFHANETNRDFQIHPQRQTHMNSFLLYFDVFFHRNFYSHVWPILLLLNFPRFLRFMIRRWKISQKFAVTHSNQSLNCN